MARSCHPRLQHAFGFNVGIRLLTPEKRLGASSMNPSSVFVHLLTYGQFLSASIKIHRGRNQPRTSRNLCQSKPMSTFEFAGSRPLKAIQLTGVSNEA